MRKFFVITALALGVALTGATMVAPAPALAKNGCTTTFEKGETTTICSKGSHGTTSTHHGSPKSKGSVEGNQPKHGGTCKKTGSSKTNTC